MCNVTTSIKPCDMGKQEIVQLQFDFTAKPVQEKPALEAVPTGRKVKKPGKRAEQAFVFEFMDMLSAPILTFDASWADAIPQALKSNITMARLIEARKEEPTATLPEVVAYIMTRTLEGPMHPEWVNIYTWCSAKYVREWEKREVPEGIAPDELSRDEKRHLKHLQNWIYERRRKIVKERMRQSA